MLYCGFNFHAVSWTQTSGVFMINGRQEDVVITFTVPVLYPTTYVRTLQVLLGILFHFSNFFPLTCSFREACIFIVYLFSWFTLINFEAVCRYWLNLYESYAICGQLCRIKLIKQIWQLSYKGIKTWKLALLAVTPWIHDQPLSVLSWTEA